MFVRIVALRYQHYTECHNSHKHSQSYLTGVMCEAIAHSNQSRLLYLPAKFKDLKFNKT